jgi:hypothetical protein
MPQTARVPIAREQVKRIGALTREAEALKRELRDLICVHRPELLEETGCGPLTAAILSDKPPELNDSQATLTSHGRPASH